MRFLPRPRDCIWFWVLDLGRLRFCAPEIRGQKTARQNPLTAVPPVLPSRTIRHVACHTDNPNIGLCHTHGDEQEVKHKPAWVALGNGAAIRRLVLCFPIRCSGVALGRGSHNTQTQTPAMPNMMPAEKPTRQPFCQNSTHTSALHEESRNRRHAKYEPTLNPKL